MEPDRPDPPPLIRTPDQRLRVFISSTLQELAGERAAAKAAVEALRLAPVMFELGARPHPPRALYRAYLAQSHLFVGLYWQRYGWVAPNETVSGLEDEYALSGDRPKLIYVKHPAPEREERLQALLDRIREDDTASYKPFSTPKELRRLLADDVALLLTEHFEASTGRLARTNSLPTASAPTLALAAEPHDPSTEPATERPSLPLPPTQLVGRARELESLSALLARPEVRLVTLLGPGGIGKSRLALELAAQQAQGWSTVTFVSLAALRDPAHVVPAIASALGVPEAPRTPLLASVKRALQGERALLILDNFEQVAPAAPVVGELLAELPKLEVLVTSRTPLRLSAEHAFPVPPLGLPHAASSPSARVPYNALAEADAVKLFVKRAQTVKPSFSLTVENAPVVAEIVRRLDGLPLAIELAAARVRLLPPPALLKRLDRRFELLTGGARDLPNRQQTLRNTIDWSFNLLDDEARAFLLRLSVFVGGCALEALGAVCTDACGTDPLAGVAALIDNNLVEERDVSLHDSGDEARFYLLESVRAYAAEKLEASGEAEEVRQRHAVHFLALAEAAASQLTGPLQQRYLEQLELEHNNLRAALSWTAFQEAWEKNLRLALALTRFWWRRGYYAEGRKWVTEALAKQPERNALHASALNGAGLLTWVQGDYKTARTLHEESVAIFRELAQDDLAFSSALGNLATIMIEEGDLGAAARLSEEVLALNRRLGDPDRIAVGLVNLGLILIHQKNFEAARARCEEALAHFRRVGDEWGVATALINLASATRHLGEYDAAHAHLLESLRLAHKLGDKETVAYALEALADIALLGEEPLRAARLLGAAEALRKAIGNPLPPSGGDVDFDRLLSSLHDQLSEEVFFKAWTEGRIMPLEEAITYALTDDFTDDAGSSLAGPLAPPPARSQRR